jgi:hypothetical protein
MQSLLARATATDVKSEPFPHLVLENALDTELCRQLLDAFPSLETVAMGDELGSNKRFSMPALAALDDPGVPPLWQEFIREQVSQDFLDRLVALFGEHIAAAYPHLDLDTLRAGIRPTRDANDASAFVDADVLLDAQISINSPVSGAPSSVRKTHLDEPHKLFAGLFYMRLPEDDSTGGDLELLRYRGRPRGFRGPMVYDRFVEPVATVPYAFNTLVIFLNSPAALHGVTTRSRTDAPRCFVNLVASVQERLFELEPMQATGVDRLLASPEILGNRLRTTLAR